MSELICTSCGKHLVKESVVHEDGFIFCNALCRYRWRATGKPMTTVRVLCFLLVAGMFALLSHADAQEYHPPKDPTFHGPEDYAKYEPDVLKCIDLLQTIPLGADDQRREANRFFLMWITGSPTVNVDILPYVLKLVEKNKDFMFTFMGGWTKYALESRDFKNKLAGHLAGVRAILNVYQKNPGVQKDPAVEEVLAVDKDGGLAEWVRKHMDEKG